MSPDSDLEKVMNAHLAGIIRELRELRDQQSVGFATIRQVMERRDERTDRDLRETNERIDNLERIINRWAGAFAFALLVIGIGMPVTLWLLGVMTR